MQKEWQQNLAVSSLKFIVVDLIGDIVHWPIWWFTTGAAKWAVFCLEKVQDAEKYLGLRIWMANLFTPMFAQYDWQGRLISFFIRLVMIIFKFIFFIIWSALILILFVLWFIVPAIAIYEIWFNLNHLINFS